MSASEPASAPPRSSRSIRRSAPSDLQRPQCLAPSGGSVEGISGTVSSSCHTSEWPPTHGQSAVLPPFQEGAPGSTHQRPSGLQTGRFLVHVFSFTQSGQSGSVRNDFTLYSGFRGSTALAPQDVIDGGSTVHSHRSTIWGARSHRTFETTGMIPS